MRSEGMGNAARTIRQRSSSAASRSRVSRARAASGCGQASPASMIAEDSAKNDLRSMEDDVGVHATLAPLAANAAADTFRPMASLIGFARAYSAPANAPVALQETTYRRGTETLPARIYRPAAH